MGDIGEFWRDVKQLWVPEIKATRKERLAKFHRNLDDVRDVATYYGVEIRVPDGEHHIQLRYRDYIGNYYPSTRKFFFQRPKLTPTMEGVPPQDVLLVFFRHALQIESMPEEVFKSWWSFDDMQRPHKDVQRVGDYLMPHVRQEVLRLGAYRPDVIDNVDPREFEHLIAKLLTDDGYDAQVTPATADGGKDIIAIANDGGREFVILVECKRWLAHNVGIEIVQRAMGVKHIDRADHSVIVTTASFTEPAKKEGTKVVDELTLIDREALFAWLRRYDRDRSASEQCDNGGV